MPANRDPRRVVWYIETRAEGLAGGPPAGMGSGVAVRLRKDGVDGTYLLTAAHVVRGPDAAGAPGYGAWLGDVRCQPPGSGYAQLPQKGPAAGRAAGKVVAAGWMGNGDVPDDERTARNDWALLELQPPADMDLDAVEWVSGWADETDETDRFTIAGYPGGHNDFAANVVEPTALPDYTLQRGAVAGTLKLSGAPTGDGMSGGGVFDGARRLVGIHRQLTNSRKLESVKAAQIRRVLEDRGYAAPPPEEPKPPPPKPPEPPEPPATPLPVGRIAAIVVGVFVVGTIGYVLWQRHKQQVLADEQRRDVTVDTKDKPTPGSGSGTAAVPTTGSGSTATGAGSGAVDVPTASSGSESSSMGSGSGSIASGSSSTATGSGSSGGSGTTAGKKTSSGPTAKPPAGPRLSLTLVGPGTVSSRPPGLYCDKATPSCSKAFAVDTEVELVAQPAVDHHYLRWSENGEAFCGGATTCKVALHRDRTLTLEMRTLQPFRVKLEGDGEGTVAASSTPINCDSPGTGRGCQANMSPWQRRTFKAVVGKGSTFAGWSGDAAACGTQQFCDVKVDEDREVVIGARFDRASPPTADADPASTP